MMRYIRDSTLLPLSPDELRLAGQVSFRDLPAKGLLLFDKSASDFLFEFEPQQDIECFLQNAHFGMKAERLVACQEDLFGVAAIQAEASPSDLLKIDLRKKLPPPLHDCPVLEAFGTIGQGGEFRGR